MQRKSKGLINKKRKPFREATSRFVDFLGSRRDGDGCRLYRAKRSHSVDERTAKTTAGTRATRASSLNTKRDRHATSVATAISMLLSSRFWLWIRRQSGDGSGSRWPRTSLLLAPRPERFDLTTTHRQNSPTTRRHCHRHHKMTKSGWVENNRV